MYLSSIFALLKPGSVTNSSISISSRNVFAWTTNRCCGALIANIGGFLLGRSAVVTDIAPFRFRLLSAHLLALSGILTVPSVNALVLSGVISEAYLRSTRWLLSVHHVGVIIAMTSVLRELLRIRNIVILTIKVRNDVHRFRHNHIG